MNKQGVISAIVIIMGVLVASAYCQTSGITLLLQQSPFEGGIITPSPGVYLFTPDTEVALTAIPKPGYQFVCWLGDVGDTTANRTVTYLNQPKIIIAVFERCAYEDLYGSGGESGGASTPDTGGGGGFTGGGGTTPTPDPPTPDPPTPDPPTPDPPTPDPPTPVPEPMTLLLLGSGSLMLLRKRRA